jgi:hypothetical protein
MSDITNFRFALNDTVDDSNIASSTLELVGCRASLKRSSIERDVTLCYCG